MPLDSSLASFPPLPAVLTCAKCEAPSSPTPVHARYSSSTPVACFIPADSSLAPLMPKEFQDKSITRREQAEAMAEPRAEQLRSVRWHLWGQLDNWQG